MVVSSLLCCVVDWNHPQRNSGEVKGYIPRVLFGGFQLGTVVCGMDARSVCTFQTYPRLCNNNDDDDAMLYAFWGLSLPF